MQWTALARRISISFIFVLALTAWRPPPDISSEAFEIPITERAIIVGLEGLHWVIVQDDSEEPGFHQMLFSLKDDRSYTVRMLSDGSDDPQEFTFMTTEDPDIFIGLYAEEFIESAQNSYFLLTRSRGGSWAMQLFLGSLESLQPGSRKAYLDPIVKRHGFTPDPNERSLSLGKVPSAASLRSLFSDHEFLGGIHNFPVPFFYLLPMNTLSVPDPEDEALWWDEIPSAHLLSEPFEITDHERARLEDLPEEWLAHAPANSVVMDVDGNLAFRVDGAVYPVFALIDLGVDVGYLAIGKGQAYVLDDSPEGEGVIVSYDFAILSFAEIGMVRFEPIKLATYDFSLRLQEITETRMERVAERHGLAFEGTVLTGNATLSSIRSLFSDPAFQVGIWTEETRFRSLKSIASEASGD